MKAGAKTHIRDCLGNTLLHKAMYEECEPLLVKLYIQNGVDPLWANNNNMTALHSFSYLLRSYRSIEKAKEKIRYLFETLPPFDAKELIEAQYADRNNQKKSVFTILMDEPCPVSDWLYSYLQEQISTKKLP